MSDSLRPRRVRASYSMDFKLELVEKSYQPGACVAQLAREHGINDNLLFTWRQRYSHLLPDEIQRSVSKPDDLRSGCRERQSAPDRELISRYPENTASRTDREGTMISLPSGTRIWLVAGATDMRKSFNGLGEQIQHVLDENPFSGHLFIFRGRRGDTVKILWADADGLCLFTKRLEEGQFIWPAVRDGKVAISRSQLAMLLDKLDWRQPKTPRLNSLTML